MSGFSRFFAVLYSITKKVNYAMAFLSGWIILVITVISTYGVYRRYLLRDPDTWTFAVSAYLLCFVIFLALSSALLEGVHVRVDIINELFPGRLARITRVISDVACIIFLWVFFSQVWRVFYTSYSRGRIDETTLAWPVAAIQWVMPFGVGLMLLTQVVILIGRFVDHPDEANQ
jgi:C4-dicarboxylate transporter DctQ subunit